MNTQIDKHSVQATMLLPLWGRAHYSELNPDILMDREAAEIIKNVDFDFSGVEKSFGLFGGICYLIRARLIDDMLKDFIYKHPRATVVNIGAGLDTTFSRVDNGSIRWYNLDLPDAIAFRQTLIQDSDRNICIAKSFFDLSWFDDIIFNKEDGIVFVSGGVFYYFTEDQVSKVFCAIAERFPGGELYFDAESKRAIALSNRMVKKTGNHGAMMYFYVNNGKTIRSWSDKIIRVNCEPYFRIPDKGRWGLGPRLRIWIIETFRMMKFVHVIFAK